MIHPPVIAYVKIAFSEHFADRCQTVTTFRPIPVPEARAMTVAGDTLFIAGPPDFIDERQAFYSPEDPKIQALLARQAEALEGRHGGQLWAFSKADGKLGVRYAMDTIPVFDGMAAAGDSLYITAVDGSVIRLGPGRSATLAKIDDKPVRIAWDKPEDPGYLLPPVVDKQADFGTAWHMP